MTDEWEELVSVVLVGTDQRPPLPGPDAAGAAGAEGLAPAVAALEHAVVHTVRARAGQRLHRGEPFPPAPHEGRALVPRAAGERLTRMLGGDHPSLLPEWLAAAAAGSWRAPAQTIVPLLEHGARDRSIRTHLGVLAGARGRWLAGLNPAWSFLLDEAAGASRGPDVWELGTRGDRLAYLRELRAADPAAALALLEQGWKKETPEDRAAFLAMLADGLSMRDEPFLEAALDDRRREVRQHAADLLTRLPVSRLCRRMAERAGRCLVLDGSRLRAEPPAACDSRMERDGVRARPLGGSDPTSWWLQQVVARTPLSFWTERFDLPPERIVELEIGDWAREVRLGWERGALLQRDVAWARALFAREPLTDLLALLPPAERAREAAGLVRRNPVDGQMIMMLGGVPAPWDRPLAEAVMKKILQTAERQPWNISELARLAGERIDPALHEPIARMSPESPVQEVAAVLQFRADMLRELRPAPSTHPDHLPRSRP